LRKRTTPLFWDVFANLLYGTITTAHTGRQPDEPVHQRHDVALLDGSFVSLGARSFGFLTMHRKKRDVIESQKEGGTTAERTASVSEPRISAGTMRAIAFTFKSYMCEPE
jgi:hypothetical protein